MDNQIIILADVLKSLDMPSLANDVLHQTSLSIIDRYVSLAEKKAIASNNEIAIERLQFAGMIY